MMDLEAKRVNHERALRQLQRSAEEIKKSGSNVTIIIEGRQVI